MTIDLDTLEAFAGMSVDEIEAILATIDNDDPRKRELDQILNADDKIWRPLPGPQFMAATSPADIVGFGGAAGGGKTDLGVGLAMTEHRRSFIVRQEATQLGGIVDRIAEILGTRDGYNGQERVFRLPHRLWKSKKMNMQIDFGSVPNPGDEKKYMGRPKDLLVLDEATGIAEAQARFLMG